jgi:hypothetical protein
MHMLLPPRSADGSVEPAGRALRRLGWLERFWISSCLRGARLGCGCLVGIYATRSRAVLTIIDAAAQGCPDSSHVVGGVVGERAAGVPVNIRRPAADGPRIS